MNVTVNVNPNINEPRVFTGLEVLNNPGIYRHQSYSEQFLISQLNSKTVLYVLNFTNNPNVIVWDVKEDNCAQWIRTSQTITLTFQGDNS